MWLTFGLTIIIVAAWITKMVVQKRFFIQRTPLDIPIGLFIISQVIATIFSLDSHISFWGYYSRWNGGLLSLITYVLLYYALASNILNQSLDETKKNVITILKVSILSGIFVALWGLPSHFGYDPTCLLFRHTFDVSCWTDAFQPKVRIFSTLGQPDWLAAYLSILIPISLFFALRTYYDKKKLVSIGYILITALFYIDLIYTKSKSSFVALLISLLLFFAIIIAKQLLQSKNNKKLSSIRFHLLIVIGFIVVTFFIGQPFAQLDKFTFDGIKAHFASSPTIVKSATINNNQPKPAPVAGEFGGTDSGKIRLFVWQGALQAWLHHPLFGTGVETFAFAYYLYRPVGHNLTSEWDYLYNKAHNEYLNYLATTGAFGLGSYLSIIGIFLFVGIKALLKNNNEPLEQWSNLLPLSLLASYLTILIANFFGFSVVIINIYFFLIPALFFIFSEQVKAQDMLSVPKLQATNNKLQLTTNAGQKIIIVVIWIIAVYLWLVLINYWLADRAYGLGMNLDKVGQYQEAYKPLHDAAASRIDEPQFQDELSINDAVLAVGAASQKDATTASQLAQEAVAVSNAIVTTYPNDVTFWKTRVRVMYTLGQLNPQYYAVALDAIQKAHALAPTDAKVDYNLSLLYSRNGQQDKAIAEMQHTIKLKPDYRDAYYALALLLHQAAVDKNNKVVDQQKEQQAVAALKFILTNLAPNDSQSLEALSAWGER